MHQGFDPSQTFAQQLSARLYDLMWRRDFEFAEAFTGVIAFAWGLVLMLPYATFDTAVSYHAMAQSGLPEWAWGAAIALPGLSQVIGLLLDWWNVRRRSALALVFVWAFIATMVGIANPISTTVPLYIGLALAAGWAYWRMRAVTP